MRWGSLSWDTRRFQFLFIEELAYGVARNIIAFCSIRIRLLVVSLKGPLVILWDNAFRCDNDGVDFDFIIQFQDFFISIACSSYFNNFSVSFFFKFNVRRTAISIIMAFLKNLFNDEYIQCSWLIYYVGPEFIFKCIFF